MKHTEKRNMLQERAEKLKKRYKLYKKRRLLSTVNLGRFVSSNSRRALERQKDIQHQSLKRPKRTSSRALSRRKLQFRAAFVFPHI